MQDAAQQRQSSRDARQQEMQALFKIACELARPAVSGFVCCVTVLGSVGLQLTVVSVWICVQPR